MFTFGELLDKVNNEVRLRSEKLKSNKPAGLYLPVDYSLETGGKRLRPALLLHSYNLYSENIEKAMPAALAIEVFHNFTLLHDDIMDKAGMRRNRPTVHVEFSENSAILSGDVMAFLAYEYLLECKSERITDVARLFTKTAIEVCEGQQHDMDFENRFDVSESEYIEMIRLKTAVLLACSLKAGVMLANAPDKITRQLYDIGENLGIAFQLQDDFLDTFGIQETFGKKIGGDILANKKTYLLIKALELASPDNKRKLQELLNSKTFIAEEKINSVREIFFKLNINKLIENKIDSYYHQAMKILEQTELTQTQKAPLEELMVRMLKRNN